MNKIMNKYLSILAETFLLILISLLIIVFLEFSLKLSHSLSNQKFKKYFENKIEKDFRHNIFNIDRISETVKKKNDNKKKIAVFGGSSIVFGSIINFPEIIQQSFPQDLLVHNYGNSGTTFYDYQSELIKMVKDYYDIILIYSGHNEAWSNIYLRSKKKNKKLKIPNNVYEYNHLLEEKKIKKKLKNAEIQISILNNKKVLKIEKILFIVKQKSRIYNILLSIFNKTKSKIKKKNEIIKTNTFPLFINYEFFSEEDKKNIVDNYISKIKQISDDQNEIYLIPVQGNLLYPPILDFLKKEYKINDAINSTKNSYNLIFNDNKDNLNKQIDFLPDGAHKLYLKGLYCLNNNTKRIIRRECFNILKNAVQKDQFPLRSLPKLNNELINTISFYNNIKIINLENEFLNVETNKQYLDQFIDYHHLSTLGQYKVSKKILNLIYPNTKIELKNIDECSNLEISIDKNVLLISPKKNKIKKSINQNISWLKYRISESSIDYLHKYYLDNSLTKLNKCN